MKYLSKKYILIGIVVIGFILRFFMLGSNPPSLDWDEASLGYNAYSILKTGKDEYGNFLPLSIRSFDDYKPPLYVYLTIPSVALIGLNDMAVRLPSAILGTLTIIVIYFLLKELLKNKNFDEMWVSWIPTVGAFFFAISPWSLQFSRAAFEGNIGLFFFTLGLLALIRGLKSSSNYFLSAISFGICLYTYHSFRLLIPLTLLVFILMFWKKIIVSKKIIFSIVIFLVFSLPVYQNLLFSNTGTGSRLSMVTVFANSRDLDLSAKRLERDSENNDYLGLVFDNRRVVYARQIAKGYLDHFNPDFLFLHGDGGRQHHAVDVGMMYWFDLPLLILGLFAVSKMLTRKTAFFLMVFLISPLPSAITTGTPHPVRAIGMLPGLIFLSSSGFSWLVYAVLNMSRKFLKIKVASISLFLIGSVIIISFLYYIHQYYVHTPLEYGDFWQYGYREAFEYAKQNESKYSKIIFTYEYDQPYVYYLYYNKIDPAWYQNNWNYNGDGTVDRFFRKIGKYEFKKINYGEDSKTSGVLIIGSPQEIPESATPLKTIHFPNGQIAFKIIST